MEKNYGNRISTILQKIKPDFTSGFRDFIILSVPTLLIIIIFNYGNQFVEYKSILSLFLNYRDTIIMICLAGILCIWFYKIKKSKNRWLEVISLLIVGSIFIFLNFNTNIMERLWGAYYPSVIIYFNVLYVPPMDPFHQIALYGIFLFRTACKKGIIVLIQLFTKF